MSYPTLHNPELTKRANQFQRLRTLRIAYASQSLYNFAQIYFQDHLTAKSCSFHLDLYKDLSEPGQNKRICRIAPRGHAKTTIISLIYVISQLALEYSDFVLLIGSKQRLAETKIIDINAELESNTLLRIDYPHLVPKIDRKGQPVKDTDSMIVFKNDSVLAATGVGSQISGIKYRNKRPKLIVPDDIDKRVASSNERENNKIWFDGVIKYIGNADQPVSIIAIDTNKHPDSLINYVAKKPEFNTKQYSAVVSDENQEVLWSDVYCYHVDQLSDWEKQNYHRRKEQGFEKIRIPFYGSWYKSERDNEPTITGLAEGSSVERQMFLQEMLNQSVVKDQMPLRKELWHYYDFSPELLKTMRYRFGALDLSEGSGNKNDYQAIAAVGYAKRKFYLLDGSLTRIDLSRQSNEDDSLAKLVVQFMARYKLHVFILESNANQGLFARAIRNQMKEKKVFCRLILRKSAGNKFDRISQCFGVVMGDGNFLIRRDWHKIHREVGMQIDEFSKLATYDDAPDATDMAVRALQGQIIAA